jgi:hypothetical protein
MVTPAGKLSVNAKSVTGELPPIFEIVNVKTVEKAEPIVLGEIAIEYDGVADSV